MTWSRFAQLLGAEHVTLGFEIALDKQVDRLTDAEWLAPPGLPASTTQTLYPRHSWSVSSPLPVIRDSFLSSSLAFVRFTFGFRLLFRCLRFPGFLTCLLEAPSCAPMHRATYDETFLPPVREAYYRRFFLDKSDTEIVVSVGKSIVIIEESLKPSLII